MCIRDSSNNCVSTFGPVVITVNANPSGTLTATETSGTNNNDNKICAGANVTFNATSGFTNYNFKVNGGSVQNGSTNTFSTTTLTNGASVTVDVTNSNGCKSTFAPVIITVNALPSATLTATENSGTANDNIICAGLNVTFTATSGFTTYNFKVNGTSAQSGGSNTFNTTTLTNGASVTADVTNSNGCTSTLGPIVITVNANPSVTLTAAETSGNAPNDNKICAGGNVTFNAPGGFSNYDFKVNGTSAQNSASNTFSTTTLTNGASVTVDVTNSNGCTSPFGPVVITVSALPTATVAINSPNPSTICSGGSTTIMFSGPPNGSLSYTKNGVLQSPLSLNGGGNNNLGTGALTLTTTYAIVSVTNANGCISSSGFSPGSVTVTAVSYTHLRAHETLEHIV